MVRSVLLDSLQRGQNPRTAALELVGKVNRSTGKRQGGFIGLTDQQSGYVRNAQDELRNLNRGYFSKSLRDKRYDATVGKAIKSGKPLPESVILRITGRYKDRLLKHRADGIAQTEMIDALRAGRHEGYVQLVESGAVVEEQITREWDSTGDRVVRPDHQILDGQKVKGLTEPFLAPDGSRMMFPGDRSLGAPTKQTIRCRCFEKVKINFRYETA